MVIGTSEIQAATLEVTRPPASETVTVPAGQPVRVAFDTAGADMAVENGDLVVRFPDGAVIVFQEIGALFEAPAPLQTSQLVQEQAWDGQPRETTQQAVRPDAEQRGAPEDLSLDQQELQALLNIQPAAGVPVGVPEGDGEGGGEEQQAQDGGSATFRTPELAELNGLNGLGLLGGEEAPGQGLPETIAVTPLAGEAGETGTSGAPGGSTTPNPQPGPQPGPPTQEAASDGQPGQGGSPGEDNPTGGSPTGENPTGENPTGENPTGGSPTGGSTDQPPPQAQPPAGEAPQTPGQNPGQNPDATPDETPQTPPQQPEEASGGGQEASPPEQEPPVQEPPVQEPPAENPPEQGSGEEEPSPPGNQGGFAEGMGPGNGNGNNGNPGNGGGNLSGDGVGSGNQGNANGQGADNQSQGYGQRLVEEESQEASLTEAMLTLTEPGEVVSGFDIAPPDQGGDILDLSQVINGFDPESLSFSLSRDGNHTDIAVQVSAGEGNEPITLAILDGASLTDGGASVPVNPAFDAADALADNLVLVTSSSGV